MSAARKDTKKPSSLPEAPLLHRCEWTVNPGVWPHIKRCENSAAYEVDWEYEDGTIGGPLELCLTHRREVVAEPTVKVLKNERIRYR